MIDSFNLPPTQPVLTARAAFDAAAAAVFSWTFTDPNGGDTQSAYRLEIVNVGTGALAHDSGRLVSANSSHTLAAGTLANSTNYQWRVTTWDAADAVSPPSDYSAFSTSAGGTVTITSPAADNQTGIIEDAYTVQWTVAGTVQAAYRVRLVRQGDGVQLSDTGFVTSTNTFHTVTGMLSGVTYRVEVTVRNAAGATSSVATRLITPDYGSPEKPQPTITPADGYLLVQVTNPVPGSVNLGTTPYGFETADVSAWETTGGTFAQSTAQAHTGTGSGLLTTTGTPAQTIVRQVPGTRTPVTGGRRYTARGWVYSPVSRSVSINIDWSTAAAGCLSTSTFIPPDLPAGVWTEIAVTGTAPNDAAFAAYGPTIRLNPPAGAQLHLDDLILVDANDLPDVVSNEIWRRTAGDQFWGWLATITPGGQYRDYAVADGITYEYLIVGRAVGASRLADIRQGMLRLEGVWLHDPADPAGTAAQFRYGRAARGTSLDVEAAAQQFAGRTWPVYDYGEQQSEAYTVRVDVPDSDDAGDGRTRLAALRRFATARTTLMLRDNRGRACYGTLSGYREDDQDAGTGVSFSFTRVDYTVPGIPATPAPR